MRDEALIKQSKTAYNQWAKQWQSHARQHFSKDHNSLNKLANSGIGKAILCAANGYSLEEHIETIRLYQGNVDIMCCDKSLGALLDNGIIPTYCMVCDANVNYEKYMEKYKDQLKDTILLINVCANPQWSKNGNWKDIYYFVNKDVINSHLEFSELSGCKNFIPAGTNVSNAMVIMLTQSDNEGRKNFFGYDKILLIGFDYSWRNDGNYYAYDYDGGGKRNYMCHTYFNTPGGKFGYTSGNLTFSKDWIKKYIDTFNLPVVQCSKDSLLQLRLNGELSYQMQYRHKSEDSTKVKYLVDKHNEVQSKLIEIKKRLEEIQKDHYQSFIKSI